MGEISLLADIPVGDGPKRSHIHMRHALSRIARRVAAEVLTSGREDVLLEVYCAGIAHATALSTLQQEGSEGGA